MKKLICKINKLGLLPKREFIIFGLVNLIILGVSIGFGIFEKNPVFFGFGPGIAVVFSILFLTRYDRIITKINNKNLLEFSELFSYFRIYIKNGYNVYNALKEITNFANENLKVMLEQLLTEIDVDKTVQPFVAFAKNFDDIIIEELMVSIFQMIDDGEQSNLLLQFEFIFDKFSDSLNEKELKKKDSILSTLSGAPLVGSCFLIIIITIGVVGLIGEMTNGI